MQFEDLQKVWDKQNQQPMYVLNEEALQQQIRRKGKKISRYITINEFGLLLISIFTTANLWFTSEHRVYAALVGVAMFSSCAYMMWGRYQRLKERPVSSSVLEELEYTISQSNYYLRFAQTFFLWFMGPIAIAMLYRVISAEAGIWKWLLMFGSLALAYFLVRLELRYKHLPRKRSLEKLRGKLMEEPLK
jgi:membrane protein implicated in regulation of membrane protease activity